MPASVSGERGSSGGDKRPARAHLAISACATLLTLLDVVHGEAVHEHGRRFKDVVPQQAVHRERCVLDVGEHHRKGGQEGLDNDEEAAVGEQLCKHTHTAN